MPAIDLMELDVLPPKCSMEAQLANQDGELFVRFRASRPRRFRSDLQSEWSGWFAYEGEPIELQWSTFWEDGGWT